MRTDRYRHAGDLDPNRGGERLCDEEGDPREVKNLAGDSRYAGVKADLAERIKPFRKK